MHIYERLVLKYSQINQQAFEENKRNTDFGKWIEKKNFKQALCECDIEMDCPIDFDV